MSTTTELTNFDDGTAGLWTAQTAGAGTATIVTGAAHDGTNGAQAVVPAATGDRAGFSRAVLPSGQVTLEGWWRVTAEGASGSNVPFGRMFYGATRLADVYRNNATAAGADNIWLRVVKAVGGSNYYFIPVAFRLELNTWVYVKFTWNVLTGEPEVWLNGTQYLYAANKPADWLLVPQIDTVWLGSQEPGNKGTWNIDTVSVTYETPTTVQQVAYEFPSTVAMDPTLNTLVTDGQGFIYALSDPSFTSPLTPKDRFGTEMNGVRTTYNGVTEEFFVDGIPIVWWSSGPYSFLIVSFTSLVNKAEASALAAQAAAASAAAGPSDASIDAALARAGAVSGWKPATAYVTGQSVVNPNGDLAIALVDHTSSAAYGTDTAKWSVGTFVSKAASPLNVKDFGAVGNGVADDTAAINAALAAVPTGGRAVYMPAGRYKVTAPLTITKDGTTLYGDGAGAKVDGTAVAFGTRIEAGGVITGQIIQVQRPSNDTPLSSVHIHSLAVDGGKLGTGVDGILFRSYSGGVRNVNIWNCSGAGLRVMGYTAWGTYDSVFSNCIFGENVGSGAVLDTGSADTHWEHDIFLHNQDNFVITGGASLQMTTCHLYSPTRHNVWFNGSGSRSKFVNCKFEGAGDDSFLIDTTVAGYSDIQITGCGFASIASTAATNTYDLLKITGPSTNAAARTTIVGCSFAHKGGEPNDARSAINLETSAAQGTAILGNSFGPASHWGTQAVIMASGSSLVNHFRGNSGVGDAVPPTTKTASYTVTTADLDNVIEIDSTTATTLTIPPVSASSPWLKGNTFKVVQVNTGTVTIAGGAGVTVRTPSATTNTRARYSTVTARMRGTNDWIVEGDLA